MVGVGDSVIFVDAVGVEHDALLTEVWRQSESILEWVRENQPEQYDNMVKHLETPSVNLIIISKDDKKSDTYGRQIERHTSVVHEVNQAAHGMYWKEK
jgi:hypothetical protein